MFWAWKDGHIPTSWLLLEVGLDSWDPITAVQEAMLTDIHLRE